VGGRIFTANYWVVEHCVGPFPVSTLLLKPTPHILHVAELTPDEATELGPLLQLVSSCIQALTSSNQVFNCLWSHGRRIPSHIHYVMQPAWTDDHVKYEGSGPALQVGQAHALTSPEVKLVKEFSPCPIDWLAQSVK
jgi:diadenosine tetraphosphate (Ap4A) HIT family hydrolase